MWSAVRVLLDGPLPHLDGEDGAGAQSRVRLPNFELEVDLVEFGQRECEYVGLDGPPPHSRCTRWLARGESVVVCLFHRLEMCLHL